LYDDRRIRIRIQSRIHTSDQWIRIRIREAQKHVDPVDPDPQQCEMNQKEGRGKDYTTDGLALVAQPLAFVACVSSEIPWEGMDM
jgi:hypothetical protein